MTDETCRRISCLDLGPHRGERHNNPRDVLYDGPELTFQVLPLAVRESAREIARECPHLTPEVVELANHILFLRGQVAAVTVDADRKVRTAMLRSESCEVHGEEIVELSKMLTHRDKAERRAEAGRLALLGFLTAVDEALRGGFRPGLTVLELVEALSKASKATHAAHKRAWSS